MDRKGLAIVAIAWNEGEILKEWLDFHLLTGVDHIYLYDDGSTDDTVSILAPYVQSGYVSHIPWSHFMQGLSKQFAAYAHAIVTFGNRWRWMAFIDLDEFLFSPSHESLKLALDQFVDLPALAVPWHMFGFCGHETRPPGSVIENFRQRAPFPPPEQAARLLKWKSIVDPFAVMEIGSAHFFKMRDGRQGAYTEERRFITLSYPPGWQCLRSDNFRLNHYFTQSKYDFISKRSDGRHVSGAKSPDRAYQRAIDIAESIESQALVYDDAIVSFYRNKTQNR